METTRSSAHRPIGRRRIGQALDFDLDGYLASRQDALVILHNATSDRMGTASGNRRDAGFDHSALFKMTETYRAGAEGQEKTTALLRAFSQSSGGPALNPVRGGKPRAQHRPCDRTHAYCPSRELALDRISFTRSCSAGTGHASKSVAFPRPRLVCHWPYAGITYGVQRLQSHFPSAIKKSCGCLWLPRLW